MVYHRAENDFGFLASGAKPDPRRYSTEQAACDGLLQALGLVAGTETEGRV
jgi:hypothetical protein